MVVVVVGIMSKLLAFKKQSDTFISDYTPKKNHPLPRCADLINGMGLGRAPFGGGHVGVCGFLAGVYGSHLLCDA